MQEKIDKIIIILMLFLLTISNFLVQDTNQYYLYVRIAGYSILMIYGIIRVIEKKPIRVIQSKLDIGILGLIGATVLPILFGTAVSLNGAVQTVLQYVYVFSVYLVLREVIQRNRQTFCSVIMKLFVILTIILIMIGIDGITSNQLGNVLKKIGIGGFLNGEHRLISVFGSPNVLAGYIASVLFLNLYELTKLDNEEIKAIHKTVTMIFLIGILLTYSKAIFLFMPFFCLLYIVCIKEKAIKMEIMGNLGISFVMAILFLGVFEKSSNTQHFDLIWFAFFLFILIDYWMNLLFLKKKLMIAKITDRKKLILSGMIILCLFVGVIIGLNIFGEYEVFTENIEADYKAKIIDQIEEDKEYLFEFDIEAIAPRDIENTYCINIIERNIKNQELNQTQIKFGTYQGIKQIKIRTQKETAEVKIEFKSAYPYQQKKLIVKSLYINQEKMPLQYKYLPTKLIEKVKNIDIHYKTAKERVEMMKNAFQLAKENNFVGIGGNGWQYRYQEVQSYSYIAKNVHSYLAKVILEFGLIGFIAYLEIAVLMIKILIESIKQQRFKTMSIIFAFGILTIHSMVDVDMEYAHILVYMFSLIALLEIDIKEKEKNKKITKISNGVLVIVVFVSLYLTSNRSIYDKYFEVTLLLKQRNGLTNYSEEYQELNGQIAKKYEQITQYEKYNVLEVYSNIVSYYLDSNSEEKSEILEKYWKKIDNYENKRWNDIDGILYKTRKVYDLLQQLENRNETKYYASIQKLIEILEQELPEVKKQTEQYLQLRDKEKLVLSEIKQIEKNVEQLKSQYLLGVKIVNESDVVIDEKALEKLEIEKTQEMLIYHTHGTESYKADLEYETYEFYKSLDENYNVIKVGQYLTELLLKEGIEATHKTEYYNYPLKEGSYARSRQAVTEILAKNQKINRIIDLHRDVNSEEEHIANTVNINGDEVAQLRFVVGINKQDENWMYDLKWMLEMQKLANEKYPGLFLPILIREKDYNQDLYKYAALIEVGENCNKIEHVLNSMKYFSKICASE